MSNNIVYQIVTEKILDQFDKGKIPWERPWTGGGLPKNLISKKEYRGINIFLLAFLPYSSPYYVSFKQCKQLGGNVRKGEKSHVVTFWKMLKGIDPKTKEEKKIPLLRYYRVFNVEQCDNIDESKIPALQKKLSKIAKIDKCEKIYTKMPKKPKLKYNGGRAYYSPSEDIIGMPKRNTFVSKEGYYSTLFHEMTHSTMHTKRLDRKEGRENFKGGHEYSKEELVAEMGAAFLCGITEIENKKTVKNSVAYINSWRNKISQDVKLVVSAAGKAQRASDYILNVKFENGSSK